MGWNEYYRRRDTLDAIVAQAGADPAGTELAGVAELGGPDQVLLALHHRWMLRLSARLELAELAAGGDDTGADPGTDPLDEVATAWRQAADANPDLRRVLDAYAERPALRRACEAEHRALAGAARLAEPGDTADQRSATGKAFLALVKQAPATPRNPVERLLRRLVAPARAS